MAQGGDRGARPSVGEVCFPLLGNLNGYDIVYNSTRRPDARMVYLMLLARKVDSSKKQSLLFQKPNFKIFLKQTKFSTFSLLGAKGFALAIFSENRRPGFRLLPPVGESAPPPLSWQVPRRGSNPQPNRYRHPWF